MATPRPFAGFDQCEGDRVLLAAKESLGAVDRIECPEARLASAAVRGPIDQANDVVCRDFRFDGCHAFDDFLDDGFRGIGMKFVGAFFAHQRVVGERVLKGAADQCLHAVVGDGHR